MWESTNRWRGAAWKTHEMLAIGMYQDEQGRWANPITEAKRASLKALKAAKAASLPAL